MILYVAALLHGAVVSLVFRHWVDWGALGRTANRMVAYALEFALYSDEPRLVFRAQARLLRENGRILRQVALPCVVAVALFGAAYAVLAPSEASVAITRSAHAPAGIAVDPVAIRIVRTGETAWRIREAVPQDSQSSWILRFTLVSSAAASAAALALSRWGRRPGDPML